jgi:steroid delta-isomerase-like uncharacterized protein
MLEENKALVRNFIEEVYNKGNLDFIDQVVASDFVRHGLGGDMSETEIIRQRVQAVRNAFPDFHITIEDQIAEGDKVVTRQTHTGTHKGEFQGIAATGKKIRVAEISIIRIQDGNIREGWVIVEQLAMLQQIGAI